MLNIPLGIILKLSNSGTRGTLGLGLGTLVEHCQFPFLKDRLDLGLNGPPPQQAFANTRFKAEEP